MRDDELDTTGIPLDDPRRARPGDQFPDVGYVRHMLGLLNGGEE